jgi:hypothetical protein
MEKPIFTIVLALLLPSMLLSTQIVQSARAYRSLIPTTCVSHADLPGNLGTILANRKKNAVEGSGSIKCTTRTRKPVKLIIHAS